ncbi:MAG TPA: carboxypeptidase-like regulatory domain-containing protein [Thermoanaerobaculia bacterium]|nr:carboxypeptidase-like regulatory domain-containing protein [Thermoanaerobaculia bacterium]
MRRYSRLFMVTAMVLSACCNGGSPTAPPVQRTNLSGVVHELNPPVFTRIPGARLTIQGKTTTSNADGEFRFTDLTPGATVLRLEKEGFRTREQPLTLRVGDNNTSQEMLPAP